MGKEMLTEDDIIIPDGVSLSYKARRFTVTGPKGTLTKKFGHLSFSVVRGLKHKKTKENMLRLQMWF